MTTKVFDLNQVNFIFGTIPVTGGYGENDYVKVKKLAADYDLMVGCDGEATRVSVNNDYVEITLTLSQTSIANIPLSAQRTLDKQVPGGAGIVPWMLKDLQGATIAAGPKAWISTPPEIEIAKGVKERVWVFTAQMADGTIFGGN